MKYLLCLLTALLLLTGSARGLEIPREVRRALPARAEEELSGFTLTDAADWTEGVMTILRRGTGRVGGIVKQRLKGAVSVVLAALLCGAAGALRSEKSPIPDCTEAACAIAITLLTVGSMDSLMGLGRETMSELQVFSRVLLPTLSTAVAATGAINTAVLARVVTVFLVDVLLTWLNRLVLPLISLYTGMLCAAACLPNSGLEPLAEGVKTAVTLLLKAFLFAFTGYLTVSRLVSGSVDAAVLKATRASVSGMIPVVGSILAESTEILLSGAGMLKNLIGVFGLLGVLAACLYPVLELGVQYLLYKLAAFAVETLGPERPGKLVSGLGSAFGLLLGAVGASAFALFVAILAAVGAVIP